MALLDDSFLVSDAYFMQVDLECEGVLSRPERDFFKHKLSSIASHKLSCSSDRSGLFRKLLEEHEKSDEFSPRLCQGWLYEILSMLVRLECCGDRVQAGEGFKKRLLSFLEANLARKIKVADMANHFSYSESHFRFLFKQAFQGSPIDFLRQFRVDYAQRLIREGRALSS